MFTKHFLCSNCFSKCLAWRFNSSCEWRGSYWSYSALLLQSKLFFLHSHCFAVHSHTVSLLCPGISLTHTGLLILPLHLRAELMAISVLAGSLQDCSVWQKCVHWSYYQQQKRLCSLSHGHGLCAERVHSDILPIIYRYTKHPHSLTARLNRIE